MNKLPWFRMYSEAVDNEKLRLIAYEDRWHFVAILCCKAQGILAEQNPDLKRRKLAVKLGLQVRELEEVSRRLAEVGLIDADTLEPTGWDSRQFTSDTDPTAAERKRRQREKSRSARTLHDVTDASRVTSRVTVTNVTRTEAEAEADTEGGGWRETSPARARETAAPPPPALPPPPEFPIQEIVDAYHEILPELPRVEKLTNGRLADAAERWRDDLQSIDAWRNYFSYIRDSDFMMGRKPGTNGRKPFKADFGWLVNSENYTHIAEDRYHG